MMITASALHFRLLHETGLTLGSMALSLLSRTRTHGLQSAKASASCLKADWEFVASPTDSHIAVHHPALSRQSRKTDLSHLPYNERC
ncbi:hypothetical protein IE81DRAFT_225344 [Ceraceosorus guamensis]|uniref:Uncharacterized protein n=1 Tax=Ceraceosorus guamensis TaxID=1522189 RepID=A0A316WAK2_9BASI|nr:hypothetical protein IE81DRAFT_225344 [Ceraceosorus guamensis]PWN45003.1 hypothetical protein IE81DRAFT_225344 [Ceraceosorus guamensis]